MNIDQKLVKHIAKIARLDLTDEEIKKLGPQMKNILDSFSKIDEVNTNNIEASFQPVKIKNRLREDIAIKCLDKNKALSLSEHKKDGYFKGPKVI